MDYSLIAFILLIIGLSLVFVEIFIPSGGMLMFLSLCCIGGSIWAGYAEWYETRPQLFWTFTGSSLVLMPIVAGVAIYYLPRTAIGKRILLQAPKLEDVTPFSEQQEHLKSLIGTEGVTASLLKPSGMALINGERLDCQSEGGILSPETPIVVIDVKEMRLIVRQIDELSEANSEQEVKKKRDEYDFEVPENEEA